jgi:transcriptional regulator with XRE-family HTH domain
MGRTDLDRRFGQRLKDLRRVHGFRQRDVALELRIGIYTLQSYEQGRTEPDLELLTDMCRLYQVSADYLLGLSDRCDPPKE